VSQHFVILPIEKDKLPLPSVYSACDGPKSGILLCPHPFAFLLLLGLVDSGFVHDEYKVHRALRGKECLVLSGTPVRVKEPQSRLPVLLVIENGPKVLQDWCSAWTSSVLGQLMILEWELTTSCTNEA
jgi:hypothetical protein